VAYEPPANEDDPEKAELIKRILSLQEYMQWVVMIRNQQTNNPTFKKLNKGTVKKLEALNKIISNKVLVTDNDFKSEASIKHWLNSWAGYEQLKSLDTHLTALENKQKWADRWNTVSDVFYVAAQALTPIGQIPILGIIVNPIVNGLWGIWYAAWAAAIGFDPKLGDNKEKHKATVNKLSAGVGLVGVAAAFVALFVPFLAPIAIPVAAAGLLGSNVFWLAGACVDFYKEIKNGKRDAGRGWRIASSASSTLYIAGSVVTAALAIAAIFTPVGWAAGAGLIAFTVGSALSSLAVFGVSKFCAWRAEKKVAAAKKNSPETTHEAIVRQRAISNTDKKNRQNSMFFGFKSGQNSTDQDNKNVGAKTHSETPLTNEEFGKTINKISEDIKQLHPETISCTPKKTAYQQSILEIQVPTNTIQKHDVIQCSQNTKKQPEITLTDNPSDKAIFVMLDVGKSFEPLTMDRCGDPNIALKIFVAAKLKNIDVILDPMDEKLLRESNNPKLSAYFTYMKQCDSEGFKSYFKNNQMHLGSIPNQPPEQSKNTTKNKLN
jgi:hypothetical protein